MPFVSKNEKLFLFSNYYFSYKFKINIKAIKIKINSNFLNTKIILNRELLRNTFSI